ncbi:hypothetical protein [Leptospira noguchii]|uniref:hypothetical protein n=1 Tax=Leptospira noguchii TaxID=28182 RepID=UPI001FB6F4A7|nr:hypothetical protein [Leptospira noguchii]UOG50910.1 hypothetical protein MAL00_19305 [Leptospira noguchii]
MIEDLVKSFKASMYDRISDPLISSFFLSLCTWNWKPIFILLKSKLPVEIRLLYVQSLYFSNYFDYLFAIGPAVTISLFYTFGYPYIKVKVIEFNSMITQKIRYIKEHYENDIKLTIEQSQNLRMKFEAEIEELKLSMNTVDNLQIELISEIRFYFAKANNIDFNDVNILIANTKTIVGLWVSSLDEKNVIPTTQWIDGVYGLVIKMISNKYCLVQRKGIVNGIFKNLIPNSFYYLKPPMADGGMTLELPKKESIILGKAKSETSFEINIENYKPTYNASSLK